jgi:AcrR family transcriptional regulator
MVQAPCAQAVQAETTTTITATTPRSTPAVAPPPARGDRLSRERILEAGLRLIGESGLEGLSMRRLAQELDVWPMSLYRYFHDKEELVAALADAAAEDIATPARSGSWRDRMRELLTQAWVILERHPGTLRPQDEGPAVGRVREAGGTILRDAGFHREEAQSAWEALLLYTAGAAAFAASAEQFQYGLDRLLDGLEKRATAPADPPP